MKLPALSTSSKPIHININYKLVCLLLSLIIILMLSVWQPWQNRYNENRTIQVTGQTTIKSAPDEYTFAPSYQAKDKDKNIASQAITAKSNEVLNRLKTFGVEDANIKTSITSYQDMYSPGNTSEQGTYVYTLLITLSINAKDQAQQIQDYLNTTSPLGMVTPTAKFSESKRTDIERAARDQATRDARTKAEQSAKNLGFELSAVKDVSDGAGFGDIVTPLYATGTAEDSSAKSNPITTPIQVGENELNYSITITYYLQ